MPHCIIQLSKKKNLIETSHFGPTDMIVADTHSQFDGYVETVRKIDFALVMLGTRCLS
jgi:hypothetical protein